MDKKFKALVTVAKTPLPAPSTYDAQTATLVDSARNVNGKMIGAVIRDDVAKVSLSWKFLSVEDWSKIGRLFKESSGGSFVNYVEFFDQTEGKYQLREMYVSDRSSAAYLRDKDTGDLIGWTECKLSLIEV
jgi:hypothetical protein